MCVSAVDYPFWTRVRPVVSIGPPVHQSWLRREKHGEKTRCLQDSRKIAWQNGLQVIIVIHNNTTSLIYIYI